MATLWDVFDSLLHEAKQDFLNYNFDKAIEKWRSYYQITAKVEYGQIIKEIERLWREINYQNINDLPSLYQCFKKLRHRFLEQQIHKYTYNLYCELLKKIYLLNFASEPADSNELEHGIFQYLNGEHSTAIQLLERRLKSDLESVEARIFLGHIYLEKGEQRKAVAFLTQNMFLAADQLYEDDLYLPQFKLLFGRLFSQLGRRNSAAWLLTFEAWFRNYLIFESDERFYKLMVQKEQNERIIRVKYNAVERYRHFTRCLFVVEYSRHFIKSNKGVIADQEQHMEQLDPVLFERYRRKRKAIKM
ncbi:MAG: hypothetical protein GXO77_03580 [Calditrichaeota bacterium]|nr:hypothetical protein [Calditrichota bacterium]